MLIECTHKVYAQYPNPAWRDYHEGSTHLSTPPKCINKRVKAWASVTALKDDKYTVTHYAMVLQNNRLEIAENIDGFIQIWS